MLWYDKVMTQEQIKYEVKVSSLEWGNMAQMVF